jgi:hypothetical protein
MLLSQTSGTEYVVDDFTIISSQGLCIKKTCSELELRIGILCSYFIIIGIATSYVL